MSGSEPTPAAPEWIGRFLNILHDLIRDAQTATGSPAESMEPNRNSGQNVHALAVRLSRVADYLEDARLLLELEGVPEEAAAWVDLRLPLRSQTDALQLELGRRGLRLEDRLGVKPVWVRVILSDLNVLVGEILDNAVRFNHPGGRIVLDAAERPGWVGVMVSDTGVGMSATARVHAAEPFFREDRPDTRALPGTGAGLYRVKRLVERNGGQLEIESQINVGTQLSLWFPVVEPGVKESS